MCPFVSQSELTHPQEENLFTNYGNDKRTRIEWSTETIPGTHRSITE